MTHSADIANYCFVDLEVLATPREGDTTLDRWWLCHPEHGAAFFRRPGSRGWSPQCNKDRRLPECLARTCPWPDVEIVHLPVAFMGQWSDEVGNTLANVPYTPGSTFSSDRNPRQEDR